MSNPNPKKHVWTDEQRKKASIAAKKRMKDPKVRAKISKGMKEALSKGIAESVVTAPAVVSPVYFVKGTVRTLALELMKRDHLDFDAFIKDAVLSYAQQYQVARPVVEVPDPAVIALERLRQANLFAAQQAQCPVNIVPLSELPPARVKRPHGPLNCLELGAERFPMYPNATKESTGDSIKWMQEPLAEVVEMDQGGDYVE